MRTGRMGQLAYDLCLEMLGSGLVLTPGWHSPSCGTGAPVRPIPLLLYNVRIDLLSRTVSSLRRLKRPFALLPPGTILRLDYLLYSATTAPGRAWRCYHERIEAAGMSMYEGMGRAIDPETFPCGLKFGRLPHQLRPRLLPLSSCYSRPSKSKRGVIPHHSTGRLVCMHSYCKLENI